MSTLNATDLENFTLDLDDREIYNDIRAECDITKILTIRPDATPEFFDRFETWVSAGDAMYVGESREVTYTAPEDHSEVRWLELVEHGGSPQTLYGWAQDECEELEGIWRYSTSLGTSLCFLPSRLAKISAEIVSRGDRSVIVELVNQSDYVCRAHFTIAYLALTPETRYIKLRSTNETRIKKYGRRVMNLKWPLGQHPNTMQSMVDAYCERYSEPTCKASMTLIGSNDTWLQHILTFAIDDRHTIVHPRLELNEDFFINSSDTSYRREGDNLLRGTFDLEQVRDMEDLTLFIIGTSLIGGTHVISS